ncbi:type I polyketide synthase [Rhodococcus tibetensis]|uniref:Acyltransferase domain-containing protein n=1 Tax=Rhodococcus tibetensis TaxID=2965064 RepID=A0ABT1QKP8_9NOCA|nr:type I polyketide synthase [Rhodococcus sp. FXJ9.536]MCQ4122370.1 acyltransferase domain-containing protein [Rhodococcus sp. FXJ9.536]
MTNNESHTGKVAVVGLDCRLPGARGAQEYWELLRTGGEAVRTLDLAEQLEAGVPQQRIADPDYVPRAATIDGVREFDASFFYISGREAERMDPQLRVFLECAWSALEDSGHNSEVYPGTIGVYAGGLGNTYQLANLLTSEHGYRGSINDMRDDMATMMGNDLNYLATRTAYHLNLTGPSVAVQAACSTSLMAVHTAAQSLLTGECDLALAGGVSIRFPQESGYLHQPDGVESPDGICRPFDAKANGTIFGNGAGVVVLKRLADAIDERDTILAVLSGSSTGNDGADRAGYTAPGERGQTSVLSEALSVSGLVPDDVQYIEAHGTGTAMGDPIEFRAINAVYGRRDTSCYVGSVKGNIGHLSVAAGVAGLIKCVLMLKHRQIAPTLYFDQWNPECGAEDTLFKIPTASAPWNVPDGVARRCAVTSAGMGGATVHVLLEEAPSLLPADPATAQPLTILPLSAKSPAALEAARQNLATHLAATGTSLTDVSHTLTTGRRVFDYRTAIVAGDAQEAVRALESGNGPNVLHDSGAPRHRPVIFMFPGQGAQYTGMGRAWYRRYGAFTEALDECADGLAGALGLDLRDALFSQKSTSNGPAVDLARTRLTQPAMFSIDYALARQWMAWGIEPDAMTGHSIGEYVAACLSGVLTLPDALRVVATRGALIDALPAGSMAAVLAPAREVQQYLPEGVSVAAVNETSVCTVSGPAEPLRSALRSLAEAGITARKIRTSHAFHSAMMEPAMPELEKALVGCRLSAPRIPFISNVTGTWITDDEATDPAYWAKHLREPVLFEQGVQTLLEEPDPVFLEVGPGQTLSSFVRRNPDRETGIPVVTSTGRTHDGDADARALLAAHARLWCAGLTMHWDRLGTGRRVPLPTYPFESHRYWVEPGEATLPAGSSPAISNKQSVDHWMWTPVWHQQQVRVDYLDDTDPSSEVFLLFEDNHRPLALKALLTERYVGSRFFTVHAGDCYGLPTNDQDGTIRPGNEGDFSALIDQLREQDNLPTRIVMAWSVGTPEGGPAAILEQELERGLHSVVALVKALTEHNVTGAIRLDLISAGAYSVTDDDPDPVAERVPLEVAAKVVGQEQANIESLHWDLPLDLDPVSLQTLTGLLATRVVHESGQALRGRGRWVRDFERVQADWTRPRRSPLHDAGTYLITGGLGEIGATVGRMLQSECQARLGLVVRTPVPPREEWDDIIAAAEDAAAQSDALIDPDAPVLRVRRLRELEAAGTGVVVVVANVADPTQLGRAIDEVEAVLGPINGVVHAAGLPSEKWDRAVTASGAEQCAWHFEAKAHGQQALEDVLRTRTVDFCLMMSSLAGVLGGLRLMAYGAANRFMDAAAERANRRENGTTWISAGWDVWQHHQDEKRAISAIGRGMDDKAIQPDEGLEIIRRLLALSGAGPIAVSTWDLQHRLDLWVRDPGTSQPSDDPGAAERPAIGSSAEEHVLGIVRDALGARDMAAGDDIFERGGDSLLIVRLLSDIRRTFDVQIPLADALDQPTAGHLADLIEVRRPVPNGAPGPAGNSTDGDLADMLAQLSAAEVDDLFDMVTPPTEPTTGVPAK